VLNTTVLPAGNFEMAQKFLNNFLEGSLTFISEARKDVIGLLAYPEGRRKPASNTKAKKKAPAKSTNTEALKECHLEEATVSVAIAAYSSYAFLFLIGSIREWIWGAGPLTKDREAFNEQKRDAYAPLFSSFETFYIRNVVRRLRDVFYQPIASVPGATVTVIERDSKDYNWSYSWTKTKTEHINLASYNYLGYAENTGSITESVIESTCQDGLTSSSSRQEMGTRSIHLELEKTVADFVGTEAAMTVGMGFATNSLNLPSLLSKGTLVISDEKNHASLILGLKVSGATTKVFKHNDINNLEFVLRKSIIHGQPRSRRPWKKIVIVIEGVYSMEGTIVKLPEIVALKKKYGTYLYLDEAHSVGAMGPNGRGIVDYYKLDPRDIDVMMGTFTKSFGAAGGYIAGSQKLIDYLRVYSQAYAYPTSVSPPVARQVISSMQEIMYGDGMTRIKTLARNSHYFRQKVQQLGCIVYGNDDSPVVPMLTFHPIKMFKFVTNLFKKGIVTVGVGFPGTLMTEERIRFCISASHTKEMLDKVIEAISQEINISNLPLSSIPIQEKIIVY
jgi:serine palmitoyltransferase